MKPLSIKALTILGSVLIISGVMLLLMERSTPVVLAQDGQADADYEGAKECASCHRNLARDHDKSTHALALLDVGKKKTGILGDFDTGEDIRTVLLPGEDTARPFTEKDIAFVIGAGQHVQRYLYEVGRNDYMVLPAEWNVETGAWEPFKLTDTWPAEQYDWEQNCAYCHTTGFDAERERWKDDGVQCEACHGPGSNHIDAAKDAGRNPKNDELIAIRSAIYTAPDSQVCGQCHARGIGEDNHPYPIGYRPGMDLSSLYQFIGKDSGDHWWVSGHASQPNMQYNEFIDGKHVASLSDMLKSKDAADDCLICHSQDARQTGAWIAAVESGDREGDPPNAVTTSTAQWGVACVTCHYPHTDSDQPFDLVQEANDLCTGCHANPAAANFIHHPVKEMFEGVTLVTGIESVPGTHFTAENGPECVTCHMQSIPVETGTTSRISHTFRPVLPGNATDIVKSACSGCHQQQTSADMQFLISDTQAAVRARLATAMDLLKNVPEPPPDTEEMTRYRQAVDALNFVQNDGSFGIHNYAYADTLLKTAENNLALLSGVSATPTPAPVPEATEAVQADTSAAASESVASGVRPVTVFVIGAVIVFLLLSAFAFFRKPAAQER